MVRFVVLFVFLLAFGEIYGFFNFNNEQTQRLFRSLGENDAQRLFQSLGENDVTRRGQVLIRALTGHSDETHIPSDSDIENPAEVNSADDSHPHGISTRSAGLDWNVIVDNLLVQAREHIISEGKDEVPIPDINESFEKRFGFIKATGRFEAWDGRVKSVSSIRRTGDVIFTSIPGQSVTLTAHLGFAVLRARYNGYKAKIWRLGPRGSIEASVGSNSVRLRLRMDVIGENSCKFVLEEVTVVDLGGFDVRITGLGPLNWLASKIVEWVARKRRGDIIANTERALRNGLTKSVERFPCDPAYSRL